jgi:glycosyltransferase involved in cell wall biosynthesis
VLLEAAASGVAVVATDVGGTRELFGSVPSALTAPGHGAILVPPGDPSALATAILRVVRSPDAAAKMGAAGRRWAEKELDVRRAVNGLLAHYAATLQFRENSPLP